MIIDDEPFVRDGLKYMLSSYPDIQVAWEAGCLDEARKLLLENRPDVAFLDIQLRGGTGFDLIPEFDSKTRIVFISAHEENFKPSFKTEAIDCILKPINPERLAQTVGKLTGES